MLNGNVIPRDIPMYRAGLTSGRAWRRTAGTAIYEALDASTMSNMVLPKGNPMSLQSANANKACDSGEPMA